MRHNMLALLFCLVGSSLGLAQETTLRVTRYETENCKTGQCVQKTIVGTLSATAFATWVEQDRALFLTCGHAFWKTGKNPKSEVIIDGKWVSARVEALSPESSGIDLAVVSAPRHGRVHPTYKIAKQRPRRSSRVQLRSTQHGLSNGTIEGTATIGGSPVLAVLYGRETQKGDSGSAVVVNDQIIGVHCWGNRRAGYVVDTAVLNDWLSANFHTHDTPKLKRPPPINPTVQQPPDVQSCRCSAHMAAMQTQIKELQQQLAALSRRTGPAGPAGPRGPTGPDGPAGPPGQSVNPIVVAGIIAKEHGYLFQPNEARIEALESELQQLKSLETSVRTLTEDGSIFSQDRIQLLQGDSIDFTLKPRK